MIKKIVSLLILHKPVTLVLLGDVKHTVSGIELSEWNDVPDFFEKISKFVPDIRIIPGNHDGNLEALIPRTVKITSPKGDILLNDVGVFHGHAWPAVELLKCKHLIMGHLHPVITLRDDFGFRTTRQVWIKAECSIRKLAHSLGKNVSSKSKGFLDSFLSKDSFSEFIIIPSFNGLLGGQPVNINKKPDKENVYFGPILRSRSIDIDKADVYMLDGTFLGKIENLKI
jgi:metallophosphoesterase superfamily enzyme